jgi:hypothetical protein
VSIPGWIHVVCRYDDAANEFLITVDNATGISNPGSTGALTSPRLLVGGIRLPSEGTTSPWPGLIDGFGWWNRKLLDSEVADLWAAGTGWEPPLPADATPDAFVFTDVSDADPSTLYASDSQIITGMDAGTAVSVTGGEYRVAGGAWTSGAGTIDPGQTLELRATSSAESEGVVTVSVTVGTVTVDWTITTAVLSSVVVNIIGNPMLNCRIIQGRIVRGWL